MITEGIVWEKTLDGWIKTLDNWPSNRRGARIVANNDLPFGDYSKAEAIGKVEGFISRPDLPEHYRKLSVIPGKMMADESKARLKDLNTKRKIERGEIEAAESYVSE